MSASLVVPPRILVAQIGARRHYAIPSILERAGLLASFHTDLTASASWLRLIHRLLPGRVTPGGLKRLLARRMETVPSSKIVHYTGFALSRILHRDRAQTPARHVKQILLQNHKFGRLVCGSNWGQANAVYVFNGAGLEILRQAKAMGMTCIMEQTSAAIGHDERLLADERERWPGWETSDMTEADWGPLAEREREEWSLADRILCGSDYVVRSIESVAGPADRCAVVSYAADSKMFTGSPRKPMDRPLRILAVGTVILRKGFQYLIEVARRLKRDGMQFRIVGSVQVSDSARRQLSEQMELVGSVPRDRIGDQYAWADVFVLPTISEGSANVCYEALASGLPVITTPHAGSVVRDGVEGFVVPIRSSDEIAKSICTLDRDRRRLEKMSLGAIDRAKMYSWETYAQRLSACLLLAPERA